MSEPTKTQSAPTVDRPRRRKTEIGVVTTDKMTKTRRVEIEYLTPHPKYGKFLRNRTICHAHDEANDTRVGDIVEIMETRPLSKLKRWRIVRIVRPAASRTNRSKPKPRRPRLDQTKRRRLKLTIRTRSNTKHPCVPLPPRRSKGRFGRSFPR